MARVTPVLRGRVTSARAGGCGVAFFRRVVLGAAASRRGAGTLMVRGADAPGRLRGVLREGFDRRRGAALRAGEDAEVGTVVRSAFVGVTADVESGCGSDAAGRSTRALTGESETGGGETAGVETDGVETGGGGTGGVETGGVVTGGMVTPPPIPPPMTIGGRATSPRSVTCTPGSATSTVPSLAMDGVATVVVGTPGTLTTTSAFAAATGMPASAARPRPIETLPSATLSGSTMGVAKLTAVGE
jgi:hypothetical protein